jgi:hypothetical protein
MDSKELNRAFSKLAGWIVSLDRLVSKAEVMAMCHYISKSTQGRLDAF